MLNYANLNLNQSGQYGQIYAEKFTSASLICKMFYGKMKAQWGKYLESEKRKAEIRDRIHKQTEQGQKTAKDYFRPAKPTPSIYDSDLKRVAVYARVSTSSEEQISSIENQTLYYTKKIAETENWNLQDIYSDEGKSGTSLRKRDAFKRMMRDAKDQKIWMFLNSIMATITLKN